MAKSLNKEKADILDSMVAEILNTGIQSEREFKLVQQYQLLNLNKEEREVKYGVIRTYEQKQIGGAPYLHIKINNQWQN